MGSWLLLTWATWRWKWNFGWNSLEHSPKQCPLLSPIFQSLIGLWVQLWHRSKTAWSKLNPVQSSRSKLMTCPRKGSLLKFQSKSTAASDGWAQKLGNNVWHDSERIATKVCSQICCKWNAMFESSVETCIDWTSFDFHIEDFFSNLLLKTTICCVTDQLHNSIKKICPQSQVLSSHISEVDKLIDENWAKLVSRGKVFNSNLCPMQ